MSAVFGRNAVIPRLLLWRKTAFPMDDSILAAKNVKYGVVAFCVMLVVVAASWSQGWEYVQASEVVQQCVRTKALTMSTISHLTKFNELTEMNSAVNEVLEYTRHSLNEKDFDSVRRDLETKLWVMELASIDMGFGQLAMHAHDALLQVQTITDTDWADPHKQRGVMMFVYNDIAGDIQDRINMSAVLRTLTLESELNRSRNWAAGSKHINVARDLLLEKQRQERDFVSKLLASDRLHAEIQIRVAKQLKMVPGIEYVPDALLMVSAGTAIVVALGPIPILFMTLLEHSYAHLLRLQEQVIVTDAWTLEERNVEVTATKFAVLLLTGQGVSYIAMLLAIAVVMRTGRAGAGLSGLAVHALDRCVGYLAGRHMYLWWFYRVMAGIRQTLFWVPSAFFFSLWLFFASNTVSLVMWAYKDPAYYLACVTPVWKLAFDPLSWLSFGVLIAYTLCTSHVREFLLNHERLSEVLGGLITWTVGTTINPSIVLGIVNIVLGATGLHSDLPGGYLQSGENPMAALLGWFIEHTVPSACIFLGKC